VAESRVRVRAQLWLVRRILVSWKSLLQILVVSVGFVVLLLCAQYVRRSEALPAVRLELGVTGRQDGREVRWTASICRAGRVFVDGVELGGRETDPAKRPQAALRELLARLKALEPPVEVAATNHDEESPGGFANHPTVRWDRDSATAAIELLGTRLIAYVADEHLERTVIPTVQDVLDLNLPEFTITRVDLPGMPYRRAYPDAADEPEVTIRSYAGHPMLDDPAKMPDDLKAFYPETLPPVAERLPENPAVLRGCDGIGQYSETAADTRLDDLMIWRRATDAQPIEYYRKVGYPSLVRFDGAGRIQPNIAWKWDVSPDNRVFTFYLRKGHKWSDGKPFTTRDMLFCLNVVAAGPTSSDVPQWMQATDGLSMLYEDDVKDWTALARRLLREAAADGPSVGRQVMNVVDRNGERLGDLRTMLQAIVGGQTPDALTRNRLVGRLNSVFGDRAFYRPEAWRGVDVESDLKALMDRGFSRLDESGKYAVNVLLWRNHRLTRIDTIDDPKLWLGGDVTRFNLAMFRAAYGDVIEPARRQRVRIEAVADEQGDDSHILRFTFPKPSSIFLENCGTFMVYLLMCNRQREYLEEYHPWGVDRMVTFDVNRWGDLFRRMKAEADTAGPSPGKHLWSLLDPDLCRRVLDAPPQDKRGTDEDGRLWDEALKKEITAEFNRVLRRRDFFDADAWAGVNTAKELHDLLTDEPDKAEHEREMGFSRLQGREQVRVRYLLEREDFLRRGPAGLSDQELLRFNLMMLRAAYDGLDQRTEALLARDRYEALDKEAQDGYDYSYWFTLFDERNFYKRRWSPHPPTLCPWRVVSEKDDQRIVLVRNPYYYKVDAHGQQLPYLDAIIDERATKKEIRQLKLRSGQIHFQSDDLEFGDFAALKENERSGDYQVRIWPYDFVGQVTFFLCQANADPEYRPIFGDPRFHQALSLALNRQEMIDIVWNGVGTPAQFAVPKGSPYYSDKLFHAFVDYDPEWAGRLLDEMGLDQRNSEGVRLLPSGRPLYMEVSFEEGSPLAAVQLATAYWRDIGINAQMKQRSGNIKWRLYQTGQWEVWAWREGGSFFGPLDGGSIAPEHPASSVHISEWTRWLRSAGRAGEEPPERIKDLDFLWNQVLTAPNEQEKMARWQELLDRTAVELPVLGVSTSPGQMVLVRNDFKNVPRLALAGWIAHDPGNVNPEVFYVERRR
jgi:ABC-type transport system substrate-binding protein